MGFTGFPENYNMFGNIFPGNSCFVLLEMPVIVGYQQTTFELILIKDLFKHFTFKKFTEKFIRYLFIFLIWNYIMFKLVWY